REKYPDATKEDLVALQELSEIVLKYEDKLKTRHDSMKRRINEFKNLVNANWEVWTHFITLTFKENITDIETAQSYFSNWVEKMNDKFEGFLFVSVKEFQQRGAIHFHCLVKIKKKMSKEEFKEVRRFWMELDGVTEKSNRIKKMGNIDIKSVMVKYVPQEHVEPEEWKDKRQRHIWSLGNYLTSYLKKGATDPRLFGKKLFTSSAKKKLKQKIVITDKEKIHQTLRAINSDGLKKNSYKIKEKTFDENGNIVTGNNDIGEMNFYNMLIKNDEKNN
ncbi:rolling circle replication-associated protein, partial [Bacillus infantis]|uniref:rolling circle replication-associated protein n=1 Tax=Bacillus infantis TaxID=324767 RepID=UPI003B849167